MGYVVSLIDFLPPARYDLVAWTSAQIEESSARSGQPWTLIDTKALAPLDIDPSVPALRSFTTTHATLPDGWYRVTFLDGGGGQSDPSDPVPNPTSLVVPPTPEMLRNLSPLLRAKFPQPPTDPFAIADLGSITTQATALVQELTWRLIDPSLGDLSAEGYTSEALPDGMVPIAVQAIARMAERIKVTTDPEFAEQLATGRRLRGFSAGPYSESYFAPGEFARRGASQGRPPVDPDDALDQALWALMTEDARDYFVWRSTGQALPTGIATAFDYRRQSIGYGAGSLGGWPSRGGPDGW